MRRVKTLIAATMLLASSVATGGVATAESNSAQSVTFLATGEVQEFVVPDGIVVLDVVACGGQGADRIAQFDRQELGAGGLGARVTSQLSVSPGQVIEVRVGGAGVGGVGGYNGGGSTQSVIAGPGAGGGASDLRLEGSELSDRVVVAGGGGGGGFSLNEGPAFHGGAGGGLSGGDGGGGAAAGKGGRQDAGGEGGIGTAFDPGMPGTLGLGGDALYGGAGGGGFYGGGAGAVAGDPFAVNVAGGGGGSSLGDETIPGNCEGDGFVTITYAPPVTVSAGAGFVVEGDDGFVKVEIPLWLSSPTSSPVTVDWTTVDLVAPGFATADSDYRSASGTVTFEPGTRQQVVTVDVFGDRERERSLFGEWGALRLSSPSSNAELRSGWFGDVGWFVIFDDDYR